MSDSKSEWVVSTTDATFVQDVVERSHLLPVVVDFWAEWCQPCRALTPALEKLAEENQGRFLLVKANTEETPAAAGQFGVQSIPSVFGLRDGDVVDGFMGALPEAEIRQGKAEVGECIIAVLGHSPRTAEMERLLGMGERQTRNDKTFQRIIGDIDPLEETARAKQCRAGVFRKFLYERALPAVAELQQA